MKYAPLASLIIGAAVILSELSYIGKSSLAWVIIGLAAAVILLAVEQINVKKV